MMQKNRVAFLVYLGVNQQADCWAVDYEEQQTIVAGS